MHIVILVACAALGISACKEDTAPHAPDESAARASPALVIGGRAIDPLCFINRHPEGQTDEDGNPLAPFYPAASCADDVYGANPAVQSPLPASFVSTAYTYTDPQSPDDRFPGLIGYRYLGDYRGLKAVQTVENSGGSGIFTALQLLRPEADGRLSIVETLAGGDRCNGGISDAFMKGHTLVYSVNLTPYDFLTVANDNPKNLQPYDDLEACAICCYGHLQYVDGRPHAIILEQDALSRIAAAPEEEQTMQTCFDEVFVSTFESQKTAFSMRELRHFARRFHKTCTAQ